MSDDVTTARWESVLDELETSIHRAQEFLVRPPAAGVPNTDSRPSDLGPTTAELIHAAQWVPPTDLGPLPEALRSRAEAVVNQQRTLTQTLNETLVTTRAHLRVADTLRQRNAPQAVYIDTLG